MQRCFQQLLVRVSSGRDVSAALHLLAGGAQNKNNCNFIDYQVNTHLLEVLLCECFGQQPKAAHNLTYIRHWIHMRAGQTSEGASGTFLVVLGRVRQRALDLLAGGQADQAEASLLMAWHPP
jgi:hypothetical protein